MRVRPRTCGVLLCVALLHGTQSRRVRKKGGEKGAGPAQGGAAVPTTSTTYGQLPGAGGAAPPGGAGQPGPRPRGVPGALPGIPPPGSQLAAVYLDVRPDGWERGTLREVSAIARTAGWTEDELEEFYEERDAKGAIVRAVQGRRAGPGGKRGSRRPTTYTEEHTADFLRALRPSGKADALFFGNPLLALKIMQEHPGEVDPNAFFRFEAQCVFHGFLPCLMARRSA